MRITDPPFALSPSPLNWTVAGIGTTGAALTVTKAATPNARHVLTSVSLIVNTSATGVTGANFIVRDGGANIFFFTCPIDNTLTAVRNGIQLSGLSFVCGVNSALDITAGAQANAVYIISFAGYTFTP